MTPKGSIKAEIVVNAGGLCARGRPPGLGLTGLAMEHHYLVTEDLPEILARSEELPHAIDFEAEIYTRQEEARCSGPTRRRPGRWSPQTTPADFGHEPPTPDLDRIAPRSSPSPTSPRSSGPASSA